MAHPYGQGPPGGYGAPPPGQPPYGGAPPPAAYPGAAPGAPYGVTPQGQYGAPPGQMPGQMPYGGGAPMQGGIPPGCDPTIFGWFQAVDMDKSGRITAAELQQALVNANYSHFNPETCRLMIGMFDKDFSGTIDLMEFQSLYHYIQQWRSTFEQLDTNRSGTIEAPELQQALQRMQYNVSLNFVHLAVCRFDVHARRSMTLDNFIQCCVMLKSLTDNFRSKDPTGMGSIRLNYEEFMTMAVANKP